jgi:multiple antibiotic resistance protein
MSIFTDFITLLVVINPLSKIIVSSSIVKRFKKMSDVVDIINFSNLIGLAIISFFALFGPFLFITLLGISFEALLIAAGISLVLFGINYLFTETLLDYGKGFGKDKTLMYLGIGTPLIAGPASISTITIISAQSNIFTTLLLVFTAVLVNYLLMGVAKGLTIGKGTNKGLDYLSTKITGLFMLAVGIQFVINGINNLV